MFKRFSLLTLLLMIVSSAYAQIQLKGVVRNQDGKPLEEVNVLLYENKTGTLTREDGAYQLFIPPNLKVLTLV
jgi:hypothetical protein